MEGDVSTVKVNFNRRGIQQGSNDEPYILVQCIHGITVLYTYHLVHNST